MEINENFNNSVLMSPPQSPLEPPSKSSTLKIAKKSTLNTEVKEYILYSVGSTTPIKRKDFGLDSSFVALGYTK